MTQTFGAIVFKIVPKRRYEEKSRGNVTIIAVLSTGGTIASRQSATGGARASDAGAALLERVTIPADVTLRVQDLMTVNSFVMTPVDMRAVVLGV